MSSPENPAGDFDRVRDYLTALQDRICAAIEATDGRARFIEDRWSRDAPVAAATDPLPGGGHSRPPASRATGPSLGGGHSRLPASPATGPSLGGGGRTRILRDGAVFEQAGIGFSDVRGQQLPPSATAARPQLAGASWRAVGVSLVFHPRNPFVPTTHANVRHFRAERDGRTVAWWFGGGFDLTPFYPVDEDVLHWHRTARALCEPFGGAERYEAHKRWCDEYFFLKHRSETRGVGGLFFDDLDQDFERDFGYLRAVGDGFLDAYLPIVERRNATPYGEPEREFQLYRRGRYVEFNLVYDRGTLFGLQSGGRAESILMSLPPRVRWEYGYTPSPDSAESRLADYLRPRDWLGESGQS